MKIGAYQFAVTGDVVNNTDLIIGAIRQAAEQQVRLLIFPECALTGYPPYDIPNSSQIDDQKVMESLTKIQKAVEHADMYVIVGTIIKNDEEYHNSAVIISPNNPMEMYHKRALFGWDADNFRPGIESGIFEIDGLKIGVRICFEVRFPEFFRELYREHTDLNIILFYDVSDHDNIERYDLIKSHIRTRAVENICHTLTVDTIKPFQTAPTGFYDRSGRILGELERNKSGLFVYDLEVNGPDFGEQGRIDISNQLLKIRSK